QTRQPTPAPPKIPPKAARLENQQWSACPQAGRRAAQHPIAQEPRSPPPQKGRFCNSARGSHQQIILCCRNTEVRRQTRSCIQEWNQKGVNCSLDSEPNSVAASSRAQSFFTTREGSRAPSPSCSVRFRLLLGDVFFKDEPSLLNRSVLVSVSTRDIAQRLRLRRMHEIRERKFALGIGVARVLKQILWLSQLMLRCMLW